MAKKIIVSTFVLWLLLALSSCTLRLKADKLEIDGQGAIADCNDYEFIASGVRPGCLFE